MWFRAIAAFSVLYGAALWAGDAAAQLRRYDQSHQYSTSILSLNGQVRPGRRMNLAGVSESQAVRAARKCAGGGEVLKPPSPTSGGGFVVKILKGSSYKTVRVDSNGRCG